MQVVIQICEYRRAFVISDPVIFNRLSIAGSEVGLRHQTFPGRRVSWIVDLVKRCKDLDSLHFIDHVLWEVWDDAIVRESMTYLEAFDAAEQLFNSNCIGI
jgi:hypothetical protein